MRTEHDDIPRLVFGGGHNERSRAEMTDRGYASHVWVQTGEDTFYPVFFYDPVRLRQDLEAEARLGRPFVAEPGMIVVPDVTEEAMTAAIETLHRDGYFAHLRPDPVGPTGVSQNEAEEQKRS